MFALQSSQDAGGQHLGCPRLYCITIHIQYFNKHHSKFHRVFFTLVVLHSPSGIGSHTPWEVKEPFHANYQGLHQHHFNSNRRITCIRSSKKQRPAEGNPSVGIIPSTAGGDHRPASPQNKLSCSHNTRHHATADTIHPSSTCVMYGL